MYGFNHTRFISYPQAVVNSNCLPLHNSTPTDSVNLSEKSGNFFGHYRNR